MVIPSTARMKTHCGVEEERTHGGDLADDSRGTTDGDVANGSGAQGAEGEQMTSMVLKPEPLGHREADFIIQLTPEDLHQGYVITPCSVTDVKKIPPYTPKS